jgi:hypothetical protein
MRLPAGQSLRMRRLLRHLPHPEGGGSTRHTPPVRGRWACSDAGVVDVSATAGPSMTGRHTILKANVLGGFEVTPPTIPTSWIGPGRDVGSGREPGG